jgi:hypothetical protein
MYTVTAGVIQDLREHIGCSSMALPSLHQRRVGAFAQDAYLRERTGRLKWPVIAWGIMGFRKKLAYNNKPLKDEMLALDDALFIAQHRQTR